MIHVGDVIENPVTGERLVFHKTSRETGGEAVVVETFVQPNGFVAAAHVHPNQEEQFEILRGSVGFKVGGKKLVAGPGKRLTVPPGTPHKSGTPAMRRRSSSARSGPHSSSSS
jgi:mannose-6-phosphate isomerase-like protein (cupin superfamily)